MCSDPSSSLPLDRAGRLTRHVVDDSIDALHLVDDARRRAAEKAHVEGIEIRRHAIDGGDGGQVSATPTSRCFLKSPDSRFGFSY